MTTTASSFKNSVKFAQSILGKMVGGIWVFVIIGFKTKNGNDGNYNEKWTVLTSLLVCFKDKEYPTQSINQSIMIKIIKNLFSTF